MYSGGDMSMDIGTDEAYMLRGPDDPPKKLKTHYVPLYALTGVFGFIFVFVPLFIRKGPNVGLIRTCIMLSAFCMWILWVTVYIAQMNPLLGPRVSKETLIWIAEIWGNRLK